MSDPHSPAGATAAFDDEPQTPMWLPALGVVLFLVVGGAWAISSFSHARTGDAPSAAPSGTAASIAASAAAAPPRPAPPPPPARPGAPAAGSASAPPWPIARPGAVTSASAAVSARPRPQRAPLGTGSPR